jgi:hypothetical protein
MKNRLEIMILALLLAAGCHRGSNSMQREQQNYDVVQEGQTSGASSTISAPGETPPPMTNTSADTTTSFTLAPNVSTAGPNGQPGSLAGTLPTTTAAPPGMQAPMATASGAPRPDQRAPIPRTVVPRVVTSTTDHDRVVVTNTQPADTATQQQTQTTTQTTQTQQTTTDMTSATPPPPQTDTTTSTQQPNDGKKKQKKDGDKKQQQDQQQNNQQQSPPPSDQPPPTSTDTSGY